jgi:hypothetical protein
VVHCWPLCLKIRHTFPTFYLMNVLFSVSENMQLVSSRLVSSHVACARANTSQEKKEQNASTDRPEVGKTTRLILVSIRFHPQDRRARAGLSGQQARRRRLGDEHLRLSHQQWRSPCHTWRIITPAERTVADPVDQAIIRHAVALVLPSILLWKQVHQD